MNIHVIKVGGSLLDLPDLPARLLRWLATQGQVQPLIVVGGGPGAEMVRQYDRWHQLGETRGHWLAVRAMQFNSHVLAASLPRSRMVADVHEARKAWRGDRLAVVDPLTWLQREHQAGVTIAHVWQFTSDSIAAHLAGQVKAPRLTLLKSTLPEQDCTLEQTAAAGLVDERFPQVARELLGIQLVNLRSDDFPVCVLRGQGG